MVKHRLKLFCIFAVSLAIFAACGGRNGENGYIPEQDVVGGQITDAPIYAQNYDYHGLIAADFVAFMSNNLYNRVPFSQREYEAALWIVDELIAMGHPAENVYIQYFDGINHGWGIPLDIYHGATTVREITAKT